MSRQPWHWPDSKLTRELRHRVLSEAGHVCEVRLPGCTRAATTVDHIVALAEGGAMYDRSNLRAACGSCNSMLGAAVGLRRQRAEHHGALAGQRFVDDAGLRSPR